MTQHRRLGPGAARALCVGFSVTAALLAVACSGGGTTGPTGDDTTTRAVATAEAWFADRGAAGFEGYVVYRYPERLQPGDTVRDFFAAETLAIERPTDLFWFDPTPTARLFHPSFVLLIEPDGGAMREVELQGWPVINGGERWGLATLDIPDADVAADPGDLRTHLDSLDDELATVLAPQISTRHAALQTECVPERHVLLLLGPRGGNAKEMNAEAAQVRKVFGGAALGVGTFKEIDLETITADSDQELNSGLVMLIGLFLEGVACCDEVVIYYIGHGSWSEGACEGGKCAPGLPDAGGWAIGNGSGYASTLSGGQMGEILKKAINEGHGCKYMLINNSCHSGEFTDEVMGVIGASGDDNPLSHGSVTVTHSSQASQPTIDGHAGQALLGAVSDAAGASLDDELSWPALLGAVRGVMSGWEWPPGETWNYSKWEYEDAYVESGGEKIRNDGGVTTATGEEREECCGKCGDGKVDTQRREQCDPPGSTCDDGDACTTGDICDDTCQCAAAPILCDTPPPCHTAVGGMCVGGDCVYPASAAGTPCDDGDPCTIEDMCSEGGACTGTIKSCNDDSFCTKDICGPGGDCVYTPQNDGFPCDDKVVCTSASMCTAGICAGTDFEHLACAVTLSEAEAACTTAECIATGCHYTAPGGACTIFGGPGTCGAAKAPQLGTGEVRECVPDEAPECQTTADCAEAASQVFGVHSGASGTLHPQCAEVVCEGFVCVVKNQPSGTSCGVDAVGCLAYACNGNGHCEVSGLASPLPEGCGCDPELSIDGQCAGLKAAFAGNECVNISCHPHPDAPAGGACRAVSKTAECDPGAEHCWRGACTKYYECLPRASVGADLQKAPGVCDDGEGCTVDACVGPKALAADAAGCSHSCDVGAVCPTDAQQVCASEGAGQCGCAGVPECTGAGECNDDNPCTADTCEGGACVHTAQPGASCDDGDACTGPGTCNGSTCEAGPPDCAPPECQGLPQCAPQVEQIVWTPTSLQGQPEFEGIVVSPQLQEQPVFFGDGTPAGALQFYFQSLNPQAFRVMPVGPTPQSQVEILDMQAQPDQPALMIVDAIDPPGCLVGVTIQVHQDLQTPGEWAHTLSDDTPLIVVPLAPDGTPQAVWQLGFNDVEAPGTLVYDTPGLEQLCAEGFHLAIGLPNGAGLWIESLTFDRILTAPDAQ